MHRGPGIAAFDREIESREQYEQLGGSIERRHIEELDGQLAVFQSQLRRFANQHADDIRSNPEFRKAFARMCQTIGVDPLMSDRKGTFWSELLGVGDFYFELAVRIIELCRRTRAENGGLLEVQHICKLLETYGRQRKNIDKLSE